MSPARPLAVFDPHPRTVPLLFDGPTRGRLESLCDVALPERSPAPADWLDRQLAEATFLIGQSALPKERLDRARRLRAVFNVEGNFLPNIDYAECQRRGIAVLGTGPVFAQPVAEMALGMALSCARRMHQADAAIRAGAETLYGEGDNQDSILLSGRTPPWSAAARSAALLPSCGPSAGPSSRTILAPSAGHPRPRRRTRAAHGVLRPRRRGVPARRGHDGQRGQRRPRALRSAAAAGDRGLVSRAGLVNFDDLLAAAAAGRIRAAIDVWPDEPVPAAHPGRRTPNTLLQAHRAGNIPEILARDGRMVTDDIELLLRGLAPQRCQPARLETVTRMRSKPVSA